MKRATKVSIKDKFKSFGLSFETKEFLDNIDENIHNSADSSIEANGRRAWLKENKPQVVNEIDNQLRKYFDIDAKNKLVFSLYKPPEEVNGKFKEPELKVKDQNENILTRIIISTINEQVGLSFSGSQEENMLLKSWEAYQTPPLFGGLLEYTFPNKKNIVIEARKGFRTVKRSKKINERYILVFDYMITKKDLELLSNSLKNIDPSKSGDDFDLTIKKLLS